MDGPVLPGSKPSVETARCSTLAAKPPNSRNEDSAMTCLGKFRALLLLLAAATAVAAQDQTQAQWQRMLELGLKHRTASGLYTTLKSDAHGGQQSPPFAQLPDCAGLWMAVG